ncbi:hypothetical protein Bca101_002407 [Brassica carinata]
MEMKTIACGVLFAAASMTTVMATDVGAPAPGPAASGASVAVPALGSLVGASLVRLSGDPIPPARTARGGAFR